MLPNPLSGVCGIEFQAIHPTRFCSVLPHDLLDHPPQGQRLTVLSPRPPSPCPACGRATSNRTPVSSTPQKCRSFPPNRPNQMCLSPKLATPTMPRVDDLVSCQGLVRALEDLRAKLGTYVAGRGPRGTPSMGWVASRVLERLALYSGGITEPVLLTELQQLWHGEEEIDWSRAEGPQAQPLPPPLAAQDPL